MKAQRKIIAYIATSADGYIARPDGDVEWLNRRPHKGDYGMGAFYATIDTILWGRRTYDWVLSYYKKKGKKGGCLTRSSPTMCSPESRRNGRLQAWNS
jgi:dihydrofolate reductase